ncbi:MULTISPECIES: alkene reductase [Streptosporangium]|uniref:N-ethylmaleimide reductase n=1 Tax=Streptosporangium brasiliense TaxID=47480 RepID=A0ABT9RJX7_9ACTN|nr:alkene reductase [Streptosporangium brasiliense]MDP9869597.1 N-ethylmaleimide reductase [Streptosporangium brasiliense]
MNELFEQVSVGKLTLPNRLVMAPMTRSRASGGLVTGLTAEYYAQRAAAGLIITEGTQPSVIGQGYIDTPGLHSPEQVEAWRRVTDAVHGQDGRIFAQLMHSGRIGHPCLYPDGALPVAPSAVASGGQIFTAEDMLDHPTPRAMTPADITSTVADFVAAARNATAAGFDGVELHTANGYLLHQFLCGSANVRSDAYGGPMENRIRFAVEVATAVTEAIGPERVGIRISPANPNNGIREHDPAEVYPALMRALAPFRPAYVHIMEFDREITKLVRAAWPGTLILNPHGTAEGKLGSAVEALRAGLCDAVSLGSLWLANPDLPERVRAGGPYNEADPATFYGGDHRGYTDYPTLEAR